MKFTAVALAAVASIAAASPAIVKRDETVTNTIIDNGNTLVQVIDYVNGGATTTTTATTTVTTTVTSESALLDIGDDEISSLLDKLFPGGGSEPAESQGPVDSLVSDVTDAAGDLISDVTDAAGDLISDVTDVVGDAISDVTGAAGDLVSDAAGVVGDVVGAVGDALGGV
ncbi:hypothetical protein LRAMOSA00766 [Lichtheimia ramosa]|uniref:Uncharacterized protein n=1 Tax=Lichtheimia ramosa TaxID=688394 RepID=A0A077W9U0_9FUNG|nr:hypothetical protein LRAMOSA00766 [Lichtheimia ramosa]